MTKKDIHILDEAIQYLCEKQDRIVITRQTLGKSGISSLIKYT